MNVLRENDVQYEIRWKKLIFFTFFGDFPLTDNEYQRRLAAPHTLTNLDTATNII